ncbi:MAG: amidohydrolase family protein [Chloroflexi bacterium]|nr:amidohydrolase family protein [Chloroflexota bacterium]
MASTAYRAKRIVDGTGGPVREDAAVVFQGERIVGVVPVAEVRAGTTVEDLGDVTILPGLIDTHVHIIWTTHPSPGSARQRESVPKVALRAAQHAALTLQCGTTTVRDVGASDGIAIALRDAINEGIVPGPRMLASGAIVAMTGGHAISVGIEVDGPYEARRAARLQLKEGADFIKIMGTGGVGGLREEAWSPQLGVEEMRAAVEEAKNAGRVAAIHAEGYKGIVNAIEAGADTIEHCNQLTPELAKVMAERGIFMVPTLAWFITVAESEPLGIFPPPYIRKGREMAAGSIRSVALAKEAGVKIAAGTDTGAPLIHHNSIRLEMELLVRLGLTPMESIESATRIAAEAMRMEKQIGTLEPGKYADLIAVGGDPTKEIKALYDLRLVVKGGAVVHRPAAAQVAVSV